MPADNAVVGAEVHRDAVVSVVPPGRVREGGLKSLYCSGVTTVLSLGCGNSSQQKS